MELFNIRPNLRGRVAAFDKFEGNTAYFKPLPTHGYTGTITFKEDPLVTDVVVDVMKRDDVQREFEIDLTLPPNPDC